MGGKAIAFGLAALLLAGDAEAFSHESVLVAETKVYDRGSVIDGTSLEAIFLLAQKQGISSIVPNIPSGKEPINLERYEVDKGVSLYVFEGSKIDVLRGLGVFIKYYPDKESRDPIKPKKSNITELLKEAEGKSISVAIPDQGNPFFVVYNPEKYSRVMRSSSSFTQDRK